MRIGAGWILSISLCVFYAPSALAATPGIWNGTAEFGTFELDVTDDGTGIDRIGYQFESWTCGSITLGGGVSFGAQWPIDNGTFSITNTLGSNQTMTLEGSFTSAAQASGSWEADMNGATCSGSWTAATNAAVSGTEVIVNHAFVQGVYWNPLVLPGWGFFADLQEENFFAAIFGYREGEASFITLQGTPVPGQELVWRGDVTYTSDGPGGPSGETVGEFTWWAGDHEGVPAAQVTLTSNILNVDQLDLMRFSYAETDELDVLSGKRWNVVRREQDMSFADYYEVTDERVTFDGIPYTRVNDLNDPAMAGAVGYFELDEGDFYAMLVEFDSTRDAFYVFLATDSDMYGRFWLVDSGTEPVGDGEHFRATSDSLQIESGNGGGTAAKARDYPTAAKTMAQDFHGVAINLTETDGAPPANVAGFRLAYRSLLGSMTAMDSTGRSQ